jgi:two-component system sensor kinase FixL
MQEGNPPRLDRRRVEKAAAQRSEGVRRVRPRTAAENALRESEIRRRAIVETLAEGVVAISGSGRISEFNAAAERMFGFSRDEVIGRNAAMLLPSPYREQYRRWLSRLRHAKRRPVLGTMWELSGKRKDGSEVPIELSLSRVGDLDAYVAIVRDISERRVQEERDRAHRAELAHALRLATVGELASGLAHQLNQPLSAISNNIQACVSRVRTRMREGQSRDRLIGLLKEVSDEALRAGTIVHSIRDMVEKRPPVFERVDLREPIQKACALLRDEIKKGDVDLRFEGLGEAIYIDADSIQIEQVLVNLLQNALDSTLETARRRPRIALSLGRNRRRMAEVTIRDNGKGIPKKRAARLFAPFFSTKPDGLGMGLALSRTILEAHGGHIRFDEGAAWSRGAAFRVELPLCSANG